MQYTSIKPEPCLLQTDDAAMLAGTLTLGQLKYCYEIARNRAKTLALLVAMGRIDADVLDADVEATDALREELVRRGVNMGLLSTY